jgi:hypothetical protein
MTGLLTLNTNSDQIIQTLTIEKMMANILFKLGAIRSIHHHSTEDENLAHFDSSFGLNVEVNLLYTQYI